MTGAVVERWFERPLAPKSCLERLGLVIDELLLGNWLQAGGLHG